jgi:hypothetical protein
VYGVLKKLRHAARLFNCWALRFYVLSGINAIKRLLRRTLVRSEQNKRNNNYKQSVDNVIQLKEL